VAGGPEAGAGAGAALITGKAAASSASVPVPPSRLPQLVLPSAGSASWFPSGTPPASPSSWGTWSVEDLSLTGSASSTPASSPSGSFSTPTATAAGQSSRKSLDEARYLRSFDSWT